MRLARAKALKAKTAKDRAIPTLTIPAGVVRAVAWREKTRPIRNSTVLFISSGCGANSDREISSERVLFIDRTHRSHGGNKPQQ